MSDEREEIPQHEMLATIKALLFERVLRWERTLDKSGEWRWTGTHPYTGEEVTCTGWQELPNCFGDMQMLLTVLLVFIAEHRDEDNRMVWSQIYDPGLEAPYVFRLLIQERNRRSEKVQKCVCECRSNNYQASVALGMLKYLGITGSHHHRTYFPTSGLQVVGGSDMRSAMNDGKASAGTIELGQPGLGKTTR